MKTLKIALLSTVLVVSSSLFAQTVEPVKKTAVKASTNRAELAKGCEDMVKRSEKKTTSKKSTATKVVKKPASLQVAEPKKAVK
jgi:hypothetical protein